MNGDYYHYLYDAVGNRERQDKFLLGLLTSDTYTYDDANRLTSLNGLAYTWDNNGNLLNDGVNTYTYDFANQLKILNGQGNTVTYTYNGLGDRLQETVSGNPTTTFTMDLNAGSDVQSGLGRPQKPQSEITHMMPSATARHRINSSWVC
ncbi:MAG TPA: hypothetical protein VFR47_00770 [Anaerolineales bacterium]|nr:hypothetical protein [Anaerolineales bacterium]